MLSDSSVDRYQTESNPYKEDKVHTASLPFDLVRVRVIYAEGLMHWSIKRGMCSLQSKEKRTEVEVVHEREWDRDWKSMLNVECYFTGSLKEERTAGRNDDDNFSFLGFSDLFQPTALHATRCSMRLIRKWLPSRYPMRYRKSWPRPPYLLPSSSLPASASLSCLVKSMRLEEAAGAANEKWEGLTVYSSGNPCPDQMTDIGKVYR